MEILCPYNWEQCFSWCFIFSLFSALPTAAWLHSTTILSAQHSSQSRQYYIYIFFVFASKCCCWCPTRDSFRRWCQRASGDVSRIVFMNILWQRCVFYYCLVGRPVFPVCDAWKGIKSTNNLLPKSTIYTFSYFYAFFVIHKNRMRSSLGAYRKFFIKKKTVSVSFEQNLFSFIKKIRALGPWMPRCHQRRSFEKTSTSNYCHKMQINLKFAYGFERCEPSPFVYKIRSGVIYKCTYIYIVRLLWQHYTAGT